MKFKAYTKIENSYRIKLLNKIQEQGYCFDDLKCCVNEKLNGSNFSIHYDGQEIKFARRKAFLSQDSNFCNWQEVIQRGEFERLIKELYQYIKAKETIILYGELCGGSYIHKDVEVTSDRRIQKGHLNSLYRLI